MNIPAKKKIRLFRFAGIAFIVLFALLYSHEEVGMSGNESGRFAVIQAVAEQGVFHIEKCNFRTVDRVVRNQHIYYDKPPALSFVWGMIYRIPHKILGWNFVDNYHLSIYLINLLTGAIINSLFFWWLFNLFRSIKKGSVEVKFLLAVLAVFTTWILSYSTMLNNHTPAALAVLGLLISLRKFQRRPDWRAAVLAGCSAGIAGLLEIPCGAFFGLAAVAGIAWSAPCGKRLRYAAVTTGTGALFVLFALGLNFYAYGTVFPLYMGDKGTFQISPHPDWLFYWEMALTGGRGVFSYAPFLLFAFPGISSQIRQKKIHSAEAVLLAGAAAFTLFYLLCTNEFGGQSYGFRYLIPLIGILWFYAGVRLLELIHDKRIVILSAILLVWGGITALTGCYHPFNIGHEGVRTPPGHFTENFSSFGGNLLCWSYETRPDSALTQLLIRRYGQRSAARYLYWSAFHQKKIELLKRIQEDFPVLRRKKSSVPLKTR